MKASQGILGLLLGACAACAWPQTNTDASARQTVGQRECGACHKQATRHYLDEPHGKVFSLNPRNEREAAGCEACHGPGSRHIEVAGELDYDGPLFIRGFGAEHAPDDADAICMTCHENATRMHWRGSSHDLAGTSCAGCHRIHGGGQATATDRCVDCHRAERAKLQRSSHMPLREGLITCTDCHNPHGGIGPGSLKRTSVNQTCYQCHPDKRGPNIYEHSPVRDDCTNCHDPHGSNNKNLLTTKLPYLCQQCHSVAFHPGALYEGADLNDSSVRQLRGKACLNCHSRIHGSNHPSGARFQR